MLGVAWVAFLATGPSWAAHGGQLTGETPAECEGLQDGGFEQGRPNPFWAEESTGFGVISSSSFFARSGQFYAAFGGSFEDPLTQALTQTVTIPVGGAELQYYLRIPETSTSTADFLRVLVDQVQIAHYTRAASPSFATYTLVEQDISEFADGGMHTIRFESFVGGEPLTTFLVDDVSLDLCAAPPVTSTPSPTLEETPTATLSETSVESPTPSPTSTLGDTPTPTVTPTEGAVRDAIFSHARGWYDGLRVEDLLEFLRSR
ncbi:MAG: hypothetical protein HUU16_13585 [Candidatus Omnitrophica bacterium]|nr:hypothetical protein [bacterium]NUN97194.1 hypothetical protein [Candidatus Omnitrophota bacterium]